MHHVEIEVTMRVNGRLIRREQSAYSTDVLNEATLATGLQAACAVRELNQRMHDESVIRQLSEATGVVGSAGLRRETDSVE